MTFKDLFFACDNLCRDTVFTVIHNGRKIYTGKLDGIQKEHRNEEIEYFSIDSNKNACTFSINDK